MTTFAESEHPRVTDGRFAEKPQSAPEASLSPGAEAFSRIQLTYIARGDSEEAATFFAGQHLQSAQDAGIAPDYLADYVETLDSYGYPGIHYPTAGELHRTGSTPAEALEALLVRRGKNVS